MSRFKCLIISHLVTSYATLASLWTTEALVANNVEYSVFFHTLQLIHLPQLEVATTKGRIAEVTITTTVVIGKFNKSTYVQ